jgi:glycosyltransferase involved in cell wall biosynthesis
MRVLLVHNYYRYFGGEDMAADNDFRLLAGHGIEVRRYSRHNDEILRYGPWEKAVFPIRAIHSSDTVESLDRALRDFPADVAYVHNVYPLISPSVYSALARRGVPVIQVLHDYRPFCANGWLYTQGRACERCTGGRHWHAVIHKCMHQSRTISAIYAASLWNLKRSGAFDRVSVFLCPSEFSRLQAIKNGIEPARLRVRPHSIDARNIPPGTGPGDYFLYLGRISREKGLDTLLRAFERLPRAPLSIAGTGPMEEEVRGRLADPSMNHVRMLGFQTGEAKLNLLRNARAVIVPSESLESFGLTVLEAYAAGRPVIASDAGALPYLVEDRVTGLIFPRQDAAALRSRVLDLVKNPAAAVQMGRQARLQAEQEYGPEKGFQRLLAILREAHETGEERTTALGARGETHAAAV